MKPILSLGLFLLGQLVSRSGVAASSIPPEGEEWRYQLLHESTYVDDCPPCGRPTFLQPLRGSFWITPGHSDPLFTRYELRQVAFTVGGVGPDSIRLEGSGELEVGGEVALTHRMTLHLKVTAPGRTEDVAFDSGLQIGEPNWLWLAVSLTEVEPRPFRVLTLTLDAMPIRDLWFSTAHGFTAALLGPKPIPVSAAEVLSDQGRVVVPLAQIEEALHLEHQEPPINLDALTVAPGGGVEFSLQVDAPSSSLTTVHHGDLVSLAGQRVKSLVDFASVIGPEPPVTDLGLDAVEHLDDGTFVFSTRESVFSQVLGDTVSRGDVMATSGHRVRTQRELLQAFKPLHPERDYGLDALVVWPS
ncbi:MAG TPA: hypothetical protein PLX89_19780, partial [Verrucomicrobiota bacterium]|nr:hypothetical protein [Verrucomicrobiota bacterium]